MNKLIVLVILLISTNSFSQTGTLKGVVTYYFNENYGDKPDIGSKVYIINKDFSEIENKFNELSKFQIEIKNLEINKLFYNKIDSGLNKKVDSLNHLIEFTFPMPTKNFRNQKKSIIEEKIQNRIKISEIEKNININKINLSNISTSINNIIIENSKHFDVIDGNGNFSFNELDYGNYFLLIISNHRFGKEVIKSVVLNQKFQTVYHNFLP